MIIKKVSHLYMEQIFGGKFHQFVYLACGLGMAVTTNGVYAADWVITPSVGLRHIYTDNATLVNEDPQSDNVTVLRPTLSILKEGARASLDLNYAPEYRHYQEETRDSEVVHFMRTEGNVEIAENHLFLDGWLRADRTNITSSRRTGIDGITGTADETEYYAGGLSPYFTAKLGNFSNVEVRLTGDRVNYSEDIGYDSRGKRGEIVFGSGSMFTSQIWELIFQKSDVEYENQDINNKTQLFRAELIQKLTTQWALAFAAGYEDYELGRTEDRDDSTWRVGAIYTPNPRTSVTLGVGDRSFGNDYYFDFSHRSSRTVWTARYEQDFVSAREELSTQPLFERYDAFGELVRNPILDEIPTIRRSTSNPSISDEYYEVKRFRTAFTYQTTRSTINLRAGYTERTYEQTIANPERVTEDSELGLVLQRRLTPLTSGFLSITSLDHEDNTTSYDQWIAALGGSYMIGRSSNVALSLNHLERDAETEEDSYDENQASISFTAQF